MKLIEIKDLEIGDEIIISRNSKLKYLKVLSKPVLGNRDLYKAVFSDKGYNWEIVGKKHKSVRCSILQKVVNYKDRWGKDKTKKFYQFEQDVSKHNHRISIDLNGRDIWLVKKGEKEELWQVQ